MGRWTQYDEDAYRLPHGMVRTGYDADTGQYYFKDRSGEMYAGQPGVQFGVMVPVDRNLNMDESQEGAATPKRRRSAASAFRSIRRSLSSVRAWRRDREDASDTTEPEPIDDEPIVVSRPTSVATESRQAAPPAAGAGTKPRASKSSRAQKAASSVPSPADTPSKPSAKPKPMPTSPSAKTPSEPPPPGTLSFSFSSSLSPASGVKLRPTSFTLPRSSAYTASTRTRRPASEQNHGPSVSSFGVLRKPRRELVIESPRPRHAHATPIFDALHTIELEAEKAEEARPEPGATPASGSARKASPTPASSPPVVGKSLTLRRSKATRRHSSDVRSGSMPEGTSRVGRRASAVAGLASTTREVSKGKTAEAPPEKENEVVASAPPKQI